jgi:hypothetical protein
MIHEGIKSGLILDNALYTSFQFTAFCLLMCCVKSKSKYIHKNDFACTFI